LTRLTPLTPVCGQNVAMHGGAVAENDSLSSNSNFSQMAPAPERASEAATRSVVISFDNMNVPAQDAI
jgi:hypothetical protein